MIRKLLLAVFAVAYFLYSTLPAIAAGLPNPIDIYGVITIDGVVPTDMSNVVISVEKTGGAVYLNSNNAIQPAYFEAIDGSMNYVYYVPVYDSAEQPKGASANDPATITVTVGGIKYNVTSPPAGAFDITTASLTDGLMLNLVAITPPFVDLASPVVTAFTIPTISNSLTIPITTLTATDNVAVTAYLVTESATAPAANDGAWSSTTPANFSFATAGAKTLYVWAKDAAGNVSTSSSATVTVDPTAPVVSAFTIPATSESFVVSPISITATDDVGVTGYQLTESAIAPSVSGNGWSATAPTSYTFNVAGTMTLYAWAKDAAGNVSAVKSSSPVAITLPDAEKPVVSAFTIPATSDSLTSAISSLTATDNIAVVGYLVNESETAPAANDNGWSTTVPVNYTFTSYGNKTLYAWAKDAVGNVSLSLSAPTTLVEQLTVTNFTAVQSVSAPHDATITALVGASFATGFFVAEASTAPLAGDAGWTTQPPTSYQFIDTTYGDKTLYAWVKDAVGNVSPSRSAAIKLVDPATLDTTAPVIELSMLADNSRTNVKTLNVSGTVADPETGITGLTVKDQSVTVGADGTFSASVQLDDGANLIVIVATNGASPRLSTTVTRSINFDATAPLITGLLPADGLSTKEEFITVTGTVDETATVSMKLGDTGILNPAAMTNTSFSLLVGPLDKGMNTIFIDATDNYDNATTTGQYKITVKYDPDAPAVSITAPSADTTSRFANFSLEGTISDDSAVTLVLEVNNAAVSSAPTIVDGKFTYPLEFDAAGNYAVKVTATDTLGNTASTATRSILYQPFTIVDVLRALKIDLGLVDKTVADSVLDVGPMENQGPKSDGMIDISDVVVLLNYVVGTYK